MAEKNEDLQGNEEGEQDPKPGDENNAGADPKNTGDQAPGPVPYDRFKEVNDRAKAYEKRLGELDQKNADREKAEETARTDALKEQEKFKDLAEEWEGKVLVMEPDFTKVKAELEVANALLQTYADGQMDSVPELFRDVVAGLPLTDRLEWLTANADKLGKKAVSGIPATPGGQGNGDEITKDQRRAKSARTF